MFARWHGVPPQLVRVQYEADPHRYRRELDSDVFDVSRRVQVWGALARRPLVVISQAHASSCSGRPAATGRWTELLNRERPEVRPPARGSSLRTGRS